MEKIDILRTIRAHDLMAKDVAERLQITTVAMSQQIQGNPRLDTLRKIADAIGCNIRDFFYLVDDDGNDIVEPTEEKEYKNELFGGPEVKTSATLAGEHQVQTHAFCPHCGAKMRVGVVMLED